MELEAVALSETLSFVMNSPYAIGAKVVDFLSDFGFKFEKEAKEAKKPEEHKEEKTGEPEAKKNQSKRGKKRAAENDIS